MSTAPTNKTYKGKPCKSCGFNERYICTRHCTYCERDKVRRWYQLNRDRASALWRIRHDKNPKRILLQKFKNKPCAYCRCRYHIKAMQIDHVGEKSIWLSGMASRRGVNEGRKTILPSVFHSSVTIDRVKTELKKCKPVCANCHQIKTALVDSRKGTYKTEGEKEWREYLKQVRSNGKENKSTTLSDRKSSDKVRRS